MTPRVKRIFLCLCLLGIVLLAAEFFFRYLYPRTNPFDDRIAERYVTPYTMFSKMNYGTKEPPKAKGELRIFMLGGSTVAYGNPPLPVYVEEELKRHGFHHVRVLNYGVISQNSSQELAHLVYHVLDSEPDMVIFYDGGNDIMDPLLYDPRPGYPFNFLAYENNVFFKEIDEYPVFSLLAYGSEMLRRLFRPYFFEHFGHFSELRRYAGYGTYSWAEKISQIYAGNLVKAAQICKAYHVEYAVFFQPLIFYKKNAVSEVEKNILQRWPELEAKLVRPYTQDMRNQILRRVLEGQKKIPFHFYDYSLFFYDTKEAVFTDYIHVNPEANKKIASAIGDVVSSMMEKVVEKQK